MKKEDCFELGYVIKPHALKGEVSLMLESDDPSAYYNLDSIFLEEKSGLVPYFIESINPQKNKMIIKFEDIDSIEAAEGLAGLKAYLPLSFLPDLSDGQFYYHEIVGFTVVDTEKGELGEISNVLSTDTQALIEMQYKGKEVLIPINDEVLQEVNRTNKTVSATLPEGLLELYLTEF